MILWYIGTVRQVEISVQSMEQGASAIVSLLPLTIIGVAFGIGNYFLAKRLGKPAVLWVVLSVIPLVNYAFFIYVMYIVMFWILDRLTSISRATEAPPATSRPEVP